MNRQSTSKTKQQVHQGCALQHLRNASERRLQPDQDNRTLFRFGYLPILTSTTGQGASTDQLWDAQAKLTPLTIPVRYSTGELPTYKSGAKDVYSPYAMLNYTGLKTSILTLVPIQYAYSKISVFY